MISVWVDGRPLGAFARRSNLWWSEAFAGGCMEASWQMDVPDRRVFSFIRRGVDVEIQAGATRVWAGLLSEPARGLREMHAVGSAAESKRFAALGVDGAAGRYLTATTEEAIARGLPWASAYHRGAPFPAHANPIFTREESSDGLNRLDVMWDAASEAAGRYWGVGPDRVPYALPRPTTPTWQVRVPADSLGIADDEFVTHIIGRYQSIPGALATIVRGNSQAAARWGRREEDVDLTARGPLTVEQAGAILDGMLAKLLPRPGYTNGLTFGSWEVVTMGGTPIHPVMMRAGHGLRLHGVRDDGLHPAAYHDITIGSIRHEVSPAGVHTVQVEPLGYVARDLQGVLQGAASPAHLVA